MRVLQILHDRERGGVQTLSRIIERGLSPHRFAFETAYLYPQSDLSIIAKLACVLRMTRRIWRGDFDILIAYQSTASILVGTIGYIRRCRLRVVHQTCTPNEVPWPVRWLDKLVGTIGLYSVNIANSAATRSEFAKYPTTYRRSMILIEHGLHAPAPRRSRQETRDRSKLPQGQPLLLNVGRLMPQKNQDVLICAIANLPQAHLALAGGGPEGELISRASCQTPRDR